MEDTLLHKLLKWIVASSVGLLALPISVFIIIFSLYPDLVTVDDFKLFKLKSYYNICDVARKDTIVSKIEFQNKYINRKKYNQYLFIDATLSTKISDEGKINFKNSLKKYLERKDTLNNKSFSVQLKETDSIKMYLFYTLIKNYVITNNFDTLFIYYYKGEHSYVNSNLIKLTNNDFSKNQYGNFPYREKLKENIIMHEINQQTNFRFIIDSIIPQFIKKDPHNILTIFSDFYHDDIKKTPKVLYRDYLFLQNHTKIYKYNFIALWSDDQSTKRKISQNELLRDFQLHLDGIKKTDYVFLDKYNEDYYNSNDDNLELLTMFDVDIGDLKDTVTFSATITNELGYNEGIAKVILKNTNKHSFHWRIKHTFSTDNNVFQGYKKFENNKDNSFYLQNMTESHIFPFISYTDKFSKKRYFYRPFYENECDSLLYLTLKLDSNCNYDDYKIAICSIDSNNYYHTECVIKVRKIFIDNKQKEILTVICDIFCILLIIILIAIEWLFYQSFYDYKKHIYKHNFSSLLFWFFGILLLGGIIVFLLTIVYSAYNFWLPKLIIIIIILAIFGKIICIIPLMTHIKRKWKIFNKQIKNQIFAKKRNYNVFIRKKRYSQKVKRGKLKSNIQDKATEKKINEEFCKTKKNVNIQLHKVKQILGNIKIKTNCLLSKFNDIISHIRGKSKK